MCSIYIKNGSGKASQQEAVAVKSWNENILDKKLCRHFGKAGSYLMDVRSNSAESVWRSHSQSVAAVWASKDKVVVKVYN